MHDDESRDCAEYLELLVKWGHIEGDAIGITKQVIDKGKQSLTDKQRHVFQKHVLDRYTLICKHCHTQMPWNDMYRALDEGDELCGWCSSINIRESQRD